jgi:hypothetical protein
MITPIPLVEIVVLASCPQCWGANPRCARCLGGGKVVVDPYREGAGEQGDDFKDLPLERALHVACTEAPSVVDRKEHDRIAATEVPGHG